MFDRITEIAEAGGQHGKGVIRAELDIRPDLWFFACHFEGDPVMPGCLGLDAMWQLTGFYLPWLGEPGRGRALGVGEVKFTGQVLPTAKLVRYEIDVRRVIRGRLNMLRRFHSEEQDDAKFRAELEGGRTCMGLPRPVSGPGDRVGNAADSALIQVKPRTRKRAPRGARHGSAVGSDQPARRAAAAGCSWSAKPWTSAASPWTRT